MAEPRDTIMVVKVDLQCETCYKKIQQVLGKYLEIRDQVYDEKWNTVTIRVISCSPEKIKQKIWCKGGECVKGIDIIVPVKPEEKPNEPEMPNPPPTAAEEPVEPGKPEPPVNPPLVAASQTHPFHPIDSADLPVLVDPLAGVDLSSIVPTPENFEEAQRVLRYNLSKELDMISPEEYNQCLLAIRKLWLNNDLSSAEQQQLRRLEDKLSSLYSTFQQSYSNLSNVKQRLEGFSVLDREYSELRGQNAKARSHAIELRAMEHKKQSDIIEFENRLVQLKSEAADIRERANQRTEDFLKGQTRLETIAVRIEANKEEADGWATECVNLKRDLASLSVQWRGLRDWDF